jgi:hypothetical protein
MMQDIEKVNRTVAARTAWRIEGTFREFPKLPPLNLWFDYPIHRADEDEVLKDAGYEGAPEPPWVQAQKNRQKQAKEQKIQSLSEFDIAFENAVDENGLAKIDVIAESLGTTSDYIKKKFGNGKQSDKEYKQRYEKVIDEDNRRAYLKRKNED